MDIDYSTKDGKILCSEKSAKKHLGRSAKPALMVLNRLKVCENLDQFLKLEAKFNRRSHLLVGDKKGMISLDLVHPFRLLIVPVPKAPKTKDGYDYKSITKVKIVDIKIDTHR